MSLLNRFYIRHGTTNDAKMCQDMTRQFKDDFGRVHITSLKEAALRHSLHIAMLDGNPVGFVSYRACLDGWQTIYELCVTREAHGSGVGRALLYSVPAPIRLKTTVDNARANRFYQHAGMKRVAVDEGKKRPLNVYHLRLLNILVQGNNKDIPQIARESGMAYGTRHIEKPRDWPFMVDIDWKRYDWRDYLNKIYTWRPVQAMVADYEHPSQRAQMLKQVEDLYAAGVLRVLVCPKFDGAVADIPPHCIVAISIPSSYAGFVPQTHELTGRRLHLLGGSPVKQRDWIPKLNATARIISTDGNAHTGAAASGVYWQGGRWTTDTQPFTLAGLAALSGANIRHDLDAALDYTQAVLL